MTVRQALKTAFKSIPKSRLAAELRISYQAVNYWYDKNRMPRTEYSGETNYSKQIQEMTSGAVTVTDLLGSIPPHQGD